METKAQAVPSILHAEIDMLSRLTNAFANFSRAMMGLRQRLFRTTREAEPDNAPQPCLVRRIAPEDGHRSVRPNDYKRPNCADLIRTQNQLVEAMLHSMILARGESIEGSDKRNGPKSER